jgi:hypothetical protein
MRSKPFFDTQICALAANGSIPHGQWIAVQDYFEECADYHISPLTLCEIIHRIHSDEAGKYFAQCQKQLRCLYPRGRRKRFFDFPRFYSARTIFGIEIPRSRSLETDFGFSVELALWAESRAGLDGVIPLPFMLTGGARLKHANFAKEVEAIRDRYKRAFGSLRGKKKFGIPPMKWMKPALDQMGLNVESSGETFLAAMSACYQFDCCLVDAARNKNYDLDKNISDLIDAQQLAYLCDPTVIFITNDSDHRIRLRGNAQASRILTFAEVFDGVTKGRDLLMGDGSSN